MGVDLAAATAHDLHKTTGASAHEHNVLLVPRPQHVPGHIVKAKQISALLAMPSGIAVHCPRVTPWLCFLRLLAANGLAQHVHLRLQLADPLDGFAQLSRQLLRVSRPVRVVYSPSPP